MGQFRDRMDDELRLRGYTADTRRAYLRCVHDFVRYFMRPPDQLTPDHIHRYQLHLARDRQVSSSAFNQAVCALRFFSREVLKQDWHVRQIPYQRTGHRRPEILSPEEVATLFRAQLDVGPRGEGGPGPPAATEWVELHQGTVPEGY